MLTIPNTTTTARYEDAGAAVFPSGNALTPYVQGTLIVANASAFVSIFKGKASGSGVWTPDALVAPSTIPISTDRISKNPDVFFGVRARDGVAGTHAQVFGALFQAGETSIIPGTEFTSRISSSGAVSPTSGVITGIIPAAGNTATAGTGFTYTHTNGTGVYVFTFNAPTPFAAAPDIQVTAYTGGNNIVPVLSAVSASGFTVTMADPGTSVGDNGFNFTAQAIA